ncbi:signal peptidase complex subunit 3 [Schistocerca americana]|uniref:signal peptidase complex subunit 3 n=1 Tax=Schistocerca americana TaxID=7009 RepID=UPI001F4F4309|nr:signal peptidase complex subunit 3 [Schistocerca americana]XP_047120786.1 signal peptidase complex subunit 3 [Schistocerca piceifrons]XP_049790725.1 signal peptidase complex subunit 3 [Schistocerca nitens]XP_049837386.1 signal peptidase complex subunit 3 [Schistocerca gregaria]XP_049938337.1 signal peptidase complex subunit 3 [Schistocerca serialis cubense]
MHSVLVRGNAILAYTLSVLAALTFCCFLSTVFMDYRTKATMNTVTVMVKKHPSDSARRELNDLGVLTFNLQTDLTDLFNWNVKQLFLYLTAEYTTPNNQLNQVVLWDKIILRGENANLDFKNMNLKYYFSDDGNGLRGNKNVTLTLSWNIIPNAGLLPSVSAIGNHTFSFPSEYTSSHVYGKETQHAGI